MGAYRKVIKWGEEGGGGLETITLSDEIGNYVRKFCRKNN